MSLDPDEINKQARDHAWNWFALHAGQRMQSFNYSLVATAFLVAAYGTLIDNNHSAACILALVGAWLAFWFNRVDHRSRQLVKAGEQALAISEERLAAHADIAKLKIVDAVERPDPDDPFNATYGLSISVIQWTIVVLFVAAAFYASFVLAVAMWAAAAVTAAALTAPVLARSRRRLCVGPHALAEWLARKVRERSSA